VTSLSTPFLHNDGPPLTVALMDNGGWWCQSDDAIIISVRVVPGGRRSEVVGTSEDRLRIRVAARPVEGKANVELVRFIAELSGVRRSAVSITAGDHSRNKTLRIAGIARPPRL
jgi:uncharacterized protein (TIGR00251 family)